MSVAVIFAGIPGLAIACWLAIEVAKRGRRWLWICIPVVLAWPGAIWIVESQSAGLPSHADVPEHFQLLAVASKPRRLEVMLVPKGADSPRLFELIDPTPEQREALFGAANRVANGVPVMGVATGGSFVMYDEPPTNLPAKF